MPDVLAAVDDVLHKHLDGGWLQHLVCDFYGWRLGAGTWRELRRERAATTAACRAFRRAFDDLADAVDESDLRS